MRLCVGRWVLCVCSVCDVCSGCNAMCAVCDVCAAVPHSKVGVLSAVCPAVCLLLLCGPHSAGAGASGVEFSGWVNDLTTQADARTNQQAQARAFPFNGLSPLSTLTCTQVGC